MIDYDTFTPQQWVQRWEAAGNLSAAAFCRREALPYQRFLQWRKAFCGSPSSHAPASAQLAGFVEVDTDALAPALSGLASLPQALTQSASGGSGGSTVVPHLGVAAVVELVLPGGLLLRIFSPPNLTGGTC